MGTIITAVLEKLAETWIGNLIAKLFPSLFGTAAKAVTVSPEAAAATAETELAQEKNANATTVQAVAAAAAADARGLRAQPSAASDAIIAAPGLARLSDPDLPYRD